MNVKKIVNNPFPTRMAVLLCVAAVGLCLQLILTRPWGIGLMPDSACYVSAARGLLEGKGFTNPPEREGVDIPYTSYGPLYPLVIAFVGFLSGGVSFESAGVLQGLLFAGNIFIVGFITLKITGSFPAALAGALIALTSLVSLEMHTRLISEPLYIFLLLLGFYQMSLFLSVQDKRKFLLGCFFLSGAFLCRFAGVAIVFSGGFALLVLSRHAIKSRILNSISFCLAVTFPMFLWTVRNRWVADGESFLWIYTPYWKTTLWELLAHVSTWILPLETPRPVRIVGLLLFLLLTLWCLIRAVKFSTTRLPLSGNLGGQEGSFFPQLAILYCVVHLMVAFFSSSFLAPMMFDNRHLSPIFFLLIPLVCKLFTSQFSKLDIRRNEVLFLRTLIFGLLVSYVVRAGFWAGDALKSGFGYASPRWINSAVLNRIAGIPHKTPIYTNVVDAVYLLLNRPALPVPAKARGRDAASGVALNDSISLNRFELERLKVDLDTQGALIALLNDVNWRAYYPTAEELIQGLGLEISESFPDGVILKKKF